MSGNSFRSVFLVASCAGAALGCYLVSLRVASERAALEQVETQIVLAERDIRLLQTEIGTRGRLAQLERWNVKVLALSAPSAEQFVGTGFELARMVAPKRQVDLEAPVVLASAPADAARPRIEGEAKPAAEPDAPKAASTSDLLHVASLKRPAEPIRTPEPAAAKLGAAKPGAGKAAATARAAPKINGDKTVSTRAAPVTKPAKVAKTDPLAPLPKSPISSRPAKDSRTTP